MENNRSIEMPSVGKRLAMVMASAVLAASTCAVPAAFAGQTGTGTTEMTVEYADQGEFGGTDAEEPYANPDEDGDQLGDNVAFTVPVAINFVVKANGDLQCSSTELYIENESSFPIHVSSMDVDPESGWNFVEDINSNGGLANSVQLELGPADDQLNAFDYLQMAHVNQPSSWNMQAAASTGTDDRVELQASGAMANINTDLTYAKRFGTVKWYVMPGEVSNVSN